MGSLFRFAYCRTCGTRYRQRPNTCCGSRGFNYSDWYIRYFAMGHSREEKIGPSRDLALRVLRMRENEVIEGRFRLHREKKILMSDFAGGRYWEVYASKQRSARTFKHIIKNHIVPEFGDMYLHQIEPYDIEGWLARLKPKYSAATVNKLLAMLKSVFRKAQEWKFITENPTQAFKLRPSDNRILRYLEPEEYRRLIDAAESEILKAAIALAVGTMLRKENLFGLCWSQVNLKARTITIPGELTKGEKALVLPIIDPVFDVLQGLPRGLHSDYVLINPLTGTRYVEGMRTAFNNAKKKAGIDPAFRWHDLRHTGASWLAQAGCDLYTIQEILGHSSPQMTQRYAHLSPGHKRKEVEKISERFIQAADNKLAAKEE